ncbi:outer membrane receptor protein involved in Fe transport [Wenyingzhuangia heitensis]|uniref:Outer membrane receptor protein involved in Fe transport n=1 Tax=Wenyingzhuangia heitensis TaxID=1487859 RepID=A0ABX0U5Z4_9FLAO|nr:TonB-dependent receptor plug domain-containing protein [Wenyingzhuangia heitensis]NIJ44217.1 outer membrane receptor protein involved in Fe transport [Wenyingzhuangia heitensis]
MKIKLTTIFFVLFSIGLYAQHTVVVKGRVLDKRDKATINMATVKVLGTSLNTIVDGNGDFVLELKQSPPIKITIQAIGYKDYNYVITAKEEELTVLLEEDITSLDAIVLSASRTPERVFESPVSVERMGLTAIENTTSPSFYDGLENMKGVDVSTGGLTFKSINTRGFAAIGNTRFVQLVDGMDNSSPGLNFPLGNLIGLNELDVQSVELLPGASSALYGANAFNGIMFMTSKSPFTHEGTSVYGKTGVTNSENTGVNEFVDVGIRVAKKINDRFAIKFTSSLLKGTDWFASDSRNINKDGKVIDGNRSNTLNYNGINIYGDEFTNPTDVGFGFASRTGYAEQDLINSDTDSFRASFSAHFKPIKNNDDTEVILSSKFGTGNTIYQGASRYALRNFIMHQHKLEIQSKHLMIRSYVTLENAGDSYDIRFAGVNTLRAENSAVKAYNQVNGTSLSVDELWFGTYGNAMAGNVSGVSGGDIVAARAAADASFRTDPNSAEFRAIFNSVINNSDLTQGAKFVDSSKLWHSDINYNFKELIDFAEVQIGASARRYDLNSEGTIFTDTKTENITYDEFGIYTQLQRKFLEDRLKLTGSLRFDKAQNFNGNFSPRASVSYNVDSERNHNIRASFQTGFRNPTTQDQYIGLYLGNTILIGSANDNPQRYNREFSVSSQAGQFAAGGTSINFNGLQGYTNSFTRSSVELFADEVEKRATEIVVNSGGTTSVSDAKQQAAAEKSGLLTQSNVDYIEPEQVKSYEFGYRGRLSKNTVLDFSAYYNQYKNFIALITTVAPLYGDVSAGVTLAELQSSDPINNSKLLLNAISEGEYTPTTLYSNTDADVASYGINIGIETKIIGNYDFGVNYAYAKQDFNQADDPDFETGFNTPEHKVKMSLGNKDIYKGLGFGLNVRWQDKFYWQSSFVDAQINARTLVDLQFMYNIIHWNSKIKVGGANIFGNEYESAPGSGTVGSQFYGSWTYNF